MAFGDQLLEKVYLETTAVGATERLLDLLEDMGQDQSINLNDIYDVWENELESRDTKKMLEAEKKNSMKEIPPICQLDLAIGFGPIENRPQRYFYNSEIGTCQPFRYGGQGGNSNNFETYEERADFCGRFEGTENTTFLKMDIDELRYF